MPVLLSRLSCFSIKPIMFCCVNERFQMRLQLERSEKYKRKRNKPLFFKKHQRKTDVLLFGWLMAVIPTYQQTFKVNIMIAKNERSLYVHNVTMTRSLNKSCMDSLLLLFIVTSLSDVVYV